MPFGDHGRQFVQMLGSAGGHRVGKFGGAGVGAVSAFQMDILDFHVTTPARRIVQQDVNARILTIFHLAAQAGVAAERQDFVRGDGLGDNGVGMACVDPDQAAVDFNQFEGIGQFAFGIIGFRQPHHRAGRADAQQGPWNGAMGGHFLAVIQGDIG